MVGLLLAAAVLVAFWPALSCGFVYHDDPLYVTLNTYVQHGLNWQSIKWAFTTGRGGNWHPLTWVSHIIDCQIYGLQPEGHHLTSVLLHLANALLLFHLLNHLTGTLWRSAFVAAMFALHPLRVESVVWISERKDVLSSFFALLAVWAYSRYAEELKIHGSRIKTYYMAAVLCFALGLMAKPMLVTLPFVVLLLDYWPLGRVQFGAGFAWRLIVEKIPFFVLAAADSVATFLLQDQAGAMVSLTHLPLSMRLANVPIAYVRYISKSFWPVNLAIFYPRRQAGLLEIGVAICLLAAVSVLVARRWRAQPYLAVGWTWFLGMLVPTIGLVQVGNQVMADRYSYLPSIGLWIAVAWGVRDWVGDNPLRRAMASFAGVTALTACVVLTPMQVKYWRNSRALYSRALAVTDQPYRAYYNLGCDALDQGNNAEAINYLKKAVSLTDDDDNAPWTDHSQAYNNLGYAYLCEGQVTNAVTNFEMAVRIRPDFPEAFYNLGRAFLDNHQPDVAIDCFQRALALAPNVAETHYKLANALAQLGRNAEAIAQYSNALQLRPGMDEAANNLAWLLATCPERSLRDGVRALALARQASEHSHNQNPVLLGTLAAAYAEAGNNSDAVATAEKARQLALAQNNPGLAGALEIQLRQYRSATEVHIHE
jgi:protein O-mannosyl-transferase